MSHLPNCIAGAKHTWEKASSSKQAKKKSGPRGRKPLASSATPTPTQPSPTPPPPPGSGRKSEPGAPDRSFRPPRPRRPGHVTTTRSNKTLVGEPRASSRQTAPPFENQNLFLALASPSSLASCSASSLERAAIHPREGETVTGALAGEGAGLKLNSAAGGMASFEMSELKKIGLGLSGFGVLFSFLGIIMLFDKGFLAIGNILFVSGVSLTIGPKSTVQFFTKPKNHKGSIAFGIGFFLVLIGWPFFGMLAEAYGFVKLFRGFWPTAAVYLQKSPTFGWIFHHPLVTSGKTSPGVIVALLLELDHSKGCRVTCKET
uniref:Vesicle transport protein n=1 Tax=Oryza glumipatula TaxID=40148 RepID=A0A0E0AM62_9ORYZ